MSPAFSTKELLFGNGAKLAFGNAARYVIVVSDPLN